MASGILQDIWGSAKYSNKESRFLESEATRSQASVRVGDGECGEMGEGGRSIDLTVPLTSGWPSNLLDNVVGGRKEERQRLGVEGVRCRQGSGYLLGFGGNCVVRPIPVSRGSTQDDWVCRFPGKITCRYDSYEAVQNQRVDMQKYKDCH